MMGMVYENLHFCSKNQEKDEKVPMVPLIPCVWIHGEESGILYLQ